MSLSVDSFGPAPLVDSRVYPGRWPDRDLLMAGECLWALTPRRDRRLEQARVQPCHCAEHGRLGMSLQAVPLSYALLRLNVTQMAKRRPFLAVGSNANPAQLHLKLSKAGVSPVVPLTLADVRGLLVGFSSHVNRHGYVPTTAVVGNSTTERRLLINWLDREQAEALNASEGNYVCAVLGVETVSVALASGEVLDAVVAYVSRHGERRDPVTNGVLELSRNMDEWSQQQKDMLSELPRSRASDEQVGDDWLTCPTYESQGGLDGPGYLCLPTSSATPRRRDSVAVMSEGDFRELGAPQRALIRSVSPNPSHDGPGVVVDVVSSSKVEAGRVELDQIPRNALGIEVRERIQLLAIRGRNPDLGSLVASHPTYTFCRVQPAPLVTMERGLVLLDPMATQVVGVESGDLAVIEGVPRSEGAKVPRVRMRVVVATEALVAERQALTGGGIESRYPSARDALGVWPDLSWAFLDQATREDLNLGSSKVAAVRIRASRRDLLLKEARELVLLLVLAAIGLLALIEDNRGRLVAVGAVLIVGVLVLIARLRRRVAKGTGT